MCVGEEIPSAQTLIEEVYPDSLVEVWVLNWDANHDRLREIRQDNNIYLPMMEGADEAFETFNLGRSFRTLPPMYIVIDKHGIVRHRSIDQGSISLEEIADMVGELIEE
ncbi:MAG: hypothetical protein HQ568_07510 [Calditrichaeota bacterium]|nr:hypothetical protein [Calditrichota bacterium]